MLRDFFARMPALRFLVLCAKALLARHGLGTAAGAGLGSYALICLAVSFLQRRAPSAATAAVEDGALGALLMDFLRHYGHEFDYEHAVVSVRTGGLLTKAEKGWANERNPLSLSVECMLNPGERGPGRGARGRA